MKRFTGTATQTAQKVQEMQMEHSREVINDDYEKKIEEEMKITTLQNHITQEFNLLKTGTGEGIAIFSAITDPPGLQGLRAGYNFKAVSCTLAYLNSPIFQFLDLTLCEI